MEMLKKVVRTKYLNYCKSMHIVNESITFSTFKYNGEFNESVEMVVIRRAI